MVSDWWNYCVCGSMRIEFGAGGNCGIEKEWKSECFGVWGRSWRNNQNNCLYRVFLQSLQSLRILSIMPNTRSLPDPNGSLYEARDFILGSDLARKALESNFPSLGIFIADFLDATHRLSQSCHLPEFTDHGLPHLCSLVDRISQWELPPDSQGNTQTLPQKLDTDQARNLLLATLIHDFGMLSQKAEDLPDNHSPSLDPAQWSDIATWVRKTHVIRLPKLLFRVMISYCNKYVNFFNIRHSHNFSDAIDIAMAHQEWPWQWTGCWQETQSNRALAAIVSVADLLDEDSARCDTETLLEHRGGNEINRAHWIRHVLTENRVMIEKGTIKIQLCRPSRTGISLKPVYSALRNHFRLVSLYETELNIIDAPITNIQLDPSTGIPSNEANLLKNWQRFDGYENESAFQFQLLRTFMPEALKDERKCSKQTIQELRTASLEDVDLSDFENAESNTEPRTPSEQTFEAITGGDR